MLLYGTYEERGYRLEAYIPDTDLDAIAFELKILGVSVSPLSILIPMMYRPTFGVDIGDLRHLESVLDRVLAILPELSNFKDEHLIALRQLEDDDGGAALRNRHAMAHGRASADAAGFEYTTNLFIAKFAPLLGDDNVMRKWMKRRLPEIDGHTPEEALRLGMTQEVVRHLLEFAKRAADDLRR